MNWTAASAGAKEEKEEVRHVIYVRVFSISPYAYDWFSLEHSDSKPPICKCGAVENLKSPVFGQPHKFRPESSVAAVGPLIYVFGGVDLDTENLDDSAEVSYIDTRFPAKGWKVCRKQMPKGRSCSYPITIDDEKVLLVGGFLLRDGDRPFAQMYHPSEDNWVPLQNYPPKKAPASLDLLGHAVVKEGGETMILMHGFNAPFLYTYNVRTDAWGTRWEEEGGFRAGYSNSALVNGIYYVLDVVTTGDLASVVLCGYDVSSEQAKCLPVEILVEDGGKQWVPLPDIPRRLPWPRLLSLSDNKLAMTWHIPCLQDKNVRRLSFYWSIFEMTVELTDDVPRLAAHPLSQVCYHFDDTNYQVYSFEPVYLPKSSTRVPRNNEKGGWNQNKVAPIDSNKYKMRSARNFKDFKESQSRSGVIMNNMYECLACDDEERR